MAEAVKIDKQDHVAIVTLNRPQVLNALNPEMARELHAGLTDLAEDSGIRCIVIAGAGDGFMAGGDLGYFNQGLPKLQSGDTEELRAMFVHVHGIVEGLYRMPQLAIAKLHGAVAGFGTSLMMACDFAVASKETKFTLAYSLIGTSPDGGSTYLLPRLIGTRKAMELAILGERFDAQQAVDLGLVNWVVPADQLDERTAALAKRIANGPAKAYANTKRLINNSFDNELDAQLTAERESFMQCATGSEFAEGVTAFLEKRPAKFL